MARNLFVSFRFSDGEKYKNELCEKFKSEDVIDYSEDEDRSSMSDESIQKYLYNKLKRTSITIIILTPDAVNHKKNFFGQYDDWMYDEIRYSLEDRSENRTNGLIALYTSEAEGLLYTNSTHTCDKCKVEKCVKNINDFDNLVRKNMMNVKSYYKENACEGLYDSLKDSYCSLVSFDSFLNNMDFYLDETIEKRERKDEFNLCKRM